MPSPDLTSQILTALTTASFPPPSTPWLLSLIPTRTPPPPLASLIATAKTRLLSLDLTTPGLLDPSATSLPPNIANPDSKETKLPRDVVLQVLDIENLSKSRWEQVEALEAIERGEQRQGREVVRLPAPGADDDEQEAELPPEDRPSVGRTAGGNAASARSTNATHRLVLQDWRGQKVHGLEVRRIERLGVGTLNIGEKMVVRSGAVVARGVVLLEPGNCKILGGKVEAWQKAWVEGRLARLREGAGVTGR